MSYVIRTNLLDASQKELNLWGEKPFALYSGKRGVSTKLNSITSANPETK
jgi:hypothetical protein